MRNIIIDLQNCDAWKIQLTIAINFISSKDSKERCVMHSSSDKFFNSICSKYHDNLETSVKGSDFIFHSVQIHLILFSSPDWIKKKKTTINPKNEDDKCFQYIIKKLSGI